MYRYFKKFKGLNLLVFILIALDAALSVTISIFLANMLNALIAKDLESFMFWILLDLSLWILDAIVQGLRDVQREKVVQKQINAVRQELLENIKSLPYPVFRKNSKEDYNSWLNNDMTLLHENGFMQIYYIFEGVVALIFSMIAIIHFHWILLATTLGLGLILYFLPRIFERKVKKETENFSLVSKEALDTSTDYLEGYEVLYNNNQISYLIAKIMKKFQKLSQAKVNLVKISAIMGYTLFGMSFVAQVVIFGVTGILVFNGSITTGVLFSIANLSGAVITYSKNVANNVVTLRATTTLFDKYPQKYEHVSSLPTQFEKKIQVKNLAVKRGKEQLNYPDFSIEKGKKYAIVGESGSGKSTLAKILIGQLADYKGEVLIDGCEIKKISEQQLHEIVALVEQKPYLFRASFEENLKIGRTISKEKFWHSLTLTKSDGFIKDKLQTTFDYNISGGQQQRISIARELMGDKSLIILDESTANLDKQTALCIEQAILKDKSITVLMITHHLFEENRVYLDEIIQL